MIRLAVEARTHSGHQWELLAAIVGMQMGQSLLSADSVVQRTVFNLLFLVIVVAAVRAMSNSHRRAMTALSVGAMAFILASIADYRASDVLAVSTCFCYLLVFGILAETVSRSVFRSGRVDLDRIAGAATIYLLIAMMFAVLFTMLEILSPGSFHLNVDLEGDRGGLNQIRLGELTYFSNITLTTLGYGDVVPVSRPARSLAALEAIIGQLYMAIVMARLVGMHIANLATSDR
ncbi:MAG: potassium channel family protein [Planctomycetota bacterium]